MKILFVICFPPQYEIYANHLIPKWKWERSDGSFIGIWADEWGDLLGNAVVDKYPDIVFEVLQVDYRADKVYSAQLKPGLFHKNFPTENLKHYSGLKKRNSPFSHALINYVRELDDDEMVLLFPASVIIPLKDAVIENLIKSKVIYYNFLNTSILLPHFKKTINPFKFLHRYLLSREKIKYLNDIRYLLNTDENQPDAISELSACFPHIKLFSFTLGTELDYWKIDQTRSSARKALGFDEESFIFFLSQRLVPEYQIDKLINVVSEIITPRKFIFLISGHGLREYEAELKKKCENLDICELVRFIGFIPNEELKIYYTACNVFATVPLMFAGSTSAIKAMAMERPVIHVTMGITYKFLKRHNAGIFVKPTDYKQWVKVFTEVIEGRNIPIVPREKLTEFFAWSTTASQLLNAVEQVKNNY